MLYRNRADDELRTAHPDQRGDAIDGAAIGVACDRRASRVVAVKARTAIDVKLGRLPRPQRDTALRTHEAGGCRAAVGRVERVVHAKSRGIDPKACQRPQPWCPFDFVLREEPSGRLEDSRLTERVQPYARLRVIQRDVRDVVVPY